MGFDLEELLSWRLADNGVDKVSSLEFSRPIHQLDNILRVGCGTDEADAVPFDDKVPQLDRVWQERSEKPQCIQCGRLGYLFGGCRNRALHAKQRVAGDFRLCRWMFERGYLCREARALVFTECWS